MSNPKLYLLKTIIDKTGNLYQVTRKLNSLDMVSLIHKYNIYTTYSGTEQMIVLNSPRKGHTLLVSDKVINKRIVFIFDEDIARQTS